MKPINADADKRRHLLAHAHDGARFLAFLLAFLRLALVLLRRERESVSWHIPSMKQREARANMVRMVDGMGNMPGQWQYASAFRRPCFKEGRAL